MQKIKPTHEVFGISKYDAEEIQIIVIKALNFENSQNSGTIVLENVFRDLNLIFNKTKFIADLEIQKRSFIYAIYILGFHLGKVKMNIDFNDLKGEDEERFKRQQDLKQKNKLN